MLDIEILKQYKMYKVPTKSIIWTIDKHTLNLKIKLYWNIYESSEIKLPPKELGTCKDWKFQFNDENGVATFIASWDIRRIKEKLDRVSIINENILTYTLDG